MLYFDSAEDRDAVIQVMEENDFEVTEFTPVGGGHQLQVLDKYWQTRPNWLPFIQGNDTKFWIKPCSLSNGVPALGVDQVDEYIDEMQRLQSVLNEVTQRVDPKYVGGSL